MRELKIIKPNIGLYIVLLIIAVVAMMLLRNCGKSGAVNEKTADTISVCIEYSPLSCYMYNDTLGGFEYDLLRLIAKKHNIAFKFVPSVSLSKSLESLNKGEYNMLVAQFPVTSTSKDDYLFTDQVYLDRQTLVQRQDSLGNVKIKSQLDLANDTLYVIKDSPMEQRIRTLSHEIGDTIYVKQEAEYGAEQLIIMVSNGDIDYAVVNEILAKKMANEMKNINIDTKISFTQFQSWVLPKSEVTLRDSLNVWLKEIKATPEYRKLYNRYF